MDEAFSQRGSKSRNGHSRAPSLAPEEAEGARQDYLDALPIAAAVLRIGGDGATVLERANDHFREIARWDERLQGAPVEKIGFLSGGTIGEALGDFLAGDQAVHQFEAEGGKGGRRFIVRLARLTSVGGRCGHCLVSLLETTAPSETGKGLRIELLRDRLTGLPNRLAFVERVEEILDHPNFQAGSYGLISLDLTCSSDRPSDAAPDELLIAFARRLCCALRAAEAGKHVADAVELSERLKTVLASPFRLSEMEARVECSIGWALLIEGAGVEDVLRQASAAQG